MSPRGQSNVVDSTTLTPLDSQFRPHSALILCPSFAQVLSRQKPASEPWRCGGPLHLCIAARVRGVYRERRGTARMNRDRVTIQWRFTRTQPRKKFGYKITRSRYRILALHGFIAGFIDAAPPPPSSSGMPERCPETASSETSLILRQWWR